VKINEKGSINENEVECTKEAIITDRYRQHLIERLYAFTLFWVLMSIYKMDFYDEVLEPFLQQLIPDNS
jgi:hypothetical protein